MYNEINQTNTIRNDGIDLIRGLSVFSVILLHCYIHLPFEQSILPQRLVNILFRSGYYGVMAFFVVSGFLITTSTIKKWGDLQNIQCKQFYLMRFARIMPCLVALLIVLSLLDLIKVNGFILHTTTLGKALFSAFTFNINWLEAKTGYLPGNWDVLWSLSVEEVFYISFPLLCIFLKNKFQLIVFMLILIILGPFARTVFSHNEIWSDHSYLSCMDGIAIGCLAAMLAKQIKLNRPLILFFFTTGLLLFMFVFFFRKQVFDIGLTPAGLNVTFLEIGIALIIIATTQELLTRDSRYGGQLTSLIRWFGRNSYEVYLTHMFVVMFIGNTFYYSKQSAIYIGLEYFTILALSGLLGHSIAKYYSNPINKKLRTSKSIKSASFSLEMG
ncbi:TPA: acyltransferase [Legionella pneumophila]|nr:acyltransferase [Legionella pneumophila]